MNGQKWKEWEKQYIRDNWRTTSDKDIGKVLGRTAHAVHAQRISTLKLSRQLTSTQEEKVACKVARMKLLIEYIELCDNPPKVDQAKKELRRLSGL